MFFSLQNKLTLDLIIFGLPYAFPLWTICQNASVVGTIEKKYIELNSILNTHFFYNERKKIELYETNLIIIKNKFNTQSFSFLKNKSKHLVIFI
jgi:hypothetical protein